MEFRSPKASIPSVARVLHACKSSKSHAWIPTKQCLTHLDILVRMHAQTLPLRLDYNTDNRILGTLSISCIGIDYNYGPYSIPPLRHFSHVLPM